MKFFKIFLLIIVSCQLFALSSQLYAQEGDLEFNLDVNSSTVALPKIFKPGIDLSGRGFHRDASWPQGLATKEALGAWQKDIGFSGIYRLQYDLWEINELAKDKDLQDKLLGNYEAVIKNITEAGGIVILNIFGTPAGLGKVLDKKTVPVDLNAFKELAKGYIKNLSCDKKYNIWYEVWSAPDSDDFFLGRQEDYLNLYRAVAEAIKELEAETKIFIPIGGPAVSWWFKNLDSNSIATPEKSLLYELMKFCCQNKLPLNFITWHAYSTDPKADKETTIYNKPTVDLIRNWLSYFNFETHLPLIVDEWNYDREANVLPERNEKSNICASYIPARLKNMHEAGIDYQIFYSLEDFQNNKEGVVRNVGLFWFDPKEADYKGGPKSIYNAFRMFTNLGKDMFPLPKFEDEFVHIIATKTEDGLAILIDNYIDPEIVRNYLSRNIASLNDKERKVLLKLMRSDKFAKIISRKSDLSKARVSKKPKSLLKKAQELNEQAIKFMEASRNLKLGIKNLKDNYLYQRYTVDAACSQSCEFIPAEEKEAAISDLYQETLILKPYSLNLIILKKKLPQPEIKAPETKETAVSQPESVQSENIESQSKEIKPTQPEIKAPEVENLTVSPEESVQSKDAQAQIKE